MGTVEARMGNLSDGMADGVVRVLWVGVWHTVWWAAWQMAWRAVDWAGLAGSLAGLAGWLG